MDNLIGKKCGPESTVLIGLQYGDEGKARVLEKLLPKYDAVVRFNGGPNAGHSLQVGDKKIALHQVPSGIFYDDKLLYIASGCVVNPEKLAEEIAEINAIGVSIEGRFLISSNATLIQPHHILLDRMFGKEIGTTGNGIGFAYSGRAVRMKGRLLENLRFGDYLSDVELGKSVVVDNLKAFSKEFGKKIDELKLADDFDAAMRNLSNFKSSNPMLIEDLISKDAKRIFFEGAQAAMLDVVSGTVPFVTSSRTISGAVYTGGELSPKHGVKVIGVAKAIMSRVGAGPFISEFGGKKSEDYCAEGNGYVNVKSKELEKFSADQLLKSQDLFEIGIALRMIGNEYGASTGRPRRIGMLDLVMLKQNCKLNGVDEVYLTKIDSLADFARTNLWGIPLVVAYELNGKTIDFIPSTANDCCDAKPVIEYLPSFKEDISSIRNFEELPSEARNLIYFVEEKIGARIAGIGVGPERDQFIEIPRRVVGGGDVCRT